MNSKYRITIAKIMIIVAMLFMLLVVAPVSLRKSTIKPRNSCLLITDPQGRVVYHGSEKDYTLKTGYKLARWKE